MNFVSESRNSSFSHIHVSVLRSSIIDGPTTALVPFCRVLGDPVAYRIRVHRSYRGGNSLLTGIALHRVLASIYCHPAEKNY